MLTKNAYKVINGFAIENLDQLFKINEKYGVWFELGKGYSAFNKKRQIEKYYFKRIRKEALEIYNYIDIKYDI